MNRLTGAAFAAVLMCSGATACASTESGIWVPRQPSPHAFSGPRQAIEGVVTVQANGCLDLDLGEQGLRWVIWPDSSTTGRSGTGIAIDGHVVADGDTVRGSGTASDGRELAAWADTHHVPVDSYGRYCSADTLGVVVLDDVVITPR